MLLAILPINFGNAQTKYKISGYVKDSNGLGVSGCNVIFNVPDIVPSVYSGAGGYYEIYAPVGTYHINVWPPFDGNYISYDEPSFSVTGDVSNKILTLGIGYKISGYITDPSGTPVVGATIHFGAYGSGWFSNSAGYYFLSAPAGTYTINARPRSGYNYQGPTTDFPQYYEYNFAVTGTTNKNITVNAPAPSNSPQARTEISGYILDANGKGLAKAEIIFNVPTIVPSVLTDSTGHYSTSAPVGTYHINVWPPFDTNYLSYDQPSFQVGTDTITKNITLNTGYKISGYLTDATGAPIRGAHVSLNQHHCGWYSNNTGYYFVTAPAGTYTLTIGPRTGPTFPTYTENNFAVNGDASRNFVLGAGQSTTNPPSENKKIFEVESNSTVSELTFNSVDQSLSFRVSGPSGTTGYTRALIAKSLAPNFTGTSVSLDGKNLTFTISSTSDYWIMEFTYSHSTHQVTIDLATNTGQMETTPAASSPSQSQQTTSTIPEFTTIAAVTSILLVSAMLALIRKKITPQN
jgi:protocatechuate 3,4-dioxygenase beta subunit